MHRFIAILTLAAAGLVSAEEVETVRRAVVPLEGWYLQGIMSTEDYAGVTIVHPATEQRLDLKLNYVAGREQSPAKLAANGDSYRLLSMAFPANQSTKRRFAKAYVQKNNEEPVWIAWHSQLEAPRPQPALSVSQPTTTTTTTSTPVAALSTATAQQP
jgi:hypothetical protein